MISTLGIKSGFVFRFSGNTLKSLIDCADVELTLNVVAAKNTSVATDGTLNFCIFIFILVLKFILIIYYISGLKHDSRFI